MCDDLNQVLTLELETPSSRPPKLTPPRRSLLSAFPAERFLLDGSRPYALFLRVLSTPVPLLPPRLASVRAERTAWRETLRTLRDDF